jgi:hypothetical protein
MPARFPLCARAGPFTETSAGRSGRLTATQPKNGGRNRSTAPRSSPRVRAGRAANTTFFACGWWNALVCSSRIVRYEDVVADIETEARRIIAYCGLPWHDNCLSFHKTDRPVCTASVTQVRQPIYNSAVGRSRVDEQSLRAAEIEVDAIDAGAEFLDQGGGAAPRPAFPSASAPP